VKLTGARYASGSAIVVCTENETIGHENGN